MPFIRVAIFVVVTEIIFPLDIILGRDLVKDALVNTAVEVVNVRGEDQKIVNVLEDFEP